MGMLEITIRAPRPEIHALEKRLRAAFPELGKHEVETTYVSRMGTVIERLYTTKQ